MADAASLALCDAEQISCPYLHRWLARAYSESDSQAAFGDYPGENLDVPTLHQTRAVVRLMLSDVPAQPLPPLDATASWIQSLRTSDGLYDDPATNAPILLETYWALDVLAAMGVAPEHPAELRLALLAALPPPAAFDPSAPAEDLLDVLGDGSLSARCLEALDGRAALDQDPALVPLREALERALSAWRSPARPRAEWTEDDQVASEAAVLSAWVSGTACPPQAQSILADLWTRPPDYPTGFLGESDFVGLVEASQRARGWAEPPQEIREAVAAYLARTEPTDVDWRGYGHVIEEWSWVDPSLNVYRTQLYAIAGRRNPVMPSLLHTLQDLRCLRGWAAVECAIPNPDWTYFCTSIASASGASGIQWDKVAAYARRCLSESSQAPEALLPSVRTLTCLGVLKDADRAAVLDFVEGSYALESGSDLDAELAAALLDAIGATPSDAVRGILVARADILSADIQTLRPDALAELARLHGLLGESAVPAEPIRARIEQLATSSGGYRFNDAVPAAELISTYFCVQAYAALDCIETLDADAVRRFVLSCWSTYGFQLAPPEDAAALGGVSEPDLLVTYLGVDILYRLAALPASP